MWNDLLTTALVGTERRALNLDNLPEDFRELADQLAGEDSERMLLALAGAKTLHRRVGQIAPLNDAPLLDPCDLDDLPPCSPRAGLLLQQILLLPYQNPHLEPWISLAAQAGQRVAEEYLPVFLNTLNRSSSTLHRFFDVLGKRGRWLAQQNESWSYAVLPQNDAEWENASFPARIAYLRRLRTVDPAHARALIESAWAGENAERRPTFLGVLRTDLSSDDEPLLEVALNDRTRGGRFVGINMLAALKGSAYSQRMIARANSLIRIHWEKSLLSRKLVIDIDLPTACDESMIRDGIDLKPESGSGDGVRTSWLFDIFKGLPTSFWLNGDWSPSDLVEAMTKLEESVKSALSSALIHAAAREQENSLPLALLQHPLVDQVTKTLALRQVTPEFFDAYIMQELAAVKTASGGEDIFRWLNYSNVAYDWSPAVTHALVSALNRVLPLLSAAEVTGYASYLTTYALKVLPGSAGSLDSLANVENKSKPVWKNAVKKAIATVEFRRDMQKEFAR